MENLFSEDWFPFVLFSVVIICVLFWLAIYQNLHKRKLKKLKYEWTWMLKKTKVFEIEQFYHSWDEDSAWYTEYWLLSKDDSWTVYKSDEYKDLQYGGRTLAEMKRKYNGVEFDLTNKDFAFRQVNDNIARIEWELANDPWIFKKRDLKLELETMKEYLTIIEEWPINPYVIIRNHKISVWDIIDVYVDPMDLKKYYFDLDFTKEKIL